MKKSLALYVLGGVFASALSLWDSILLGNEFSKYGLVIASVVLSPITSALGVLTSIALVVFALCVRKDKLPFLPPAVIGALHVLLALPLMLLPTASLAGIFEIWRFGDAFHHYRLIAFGLLGGAALGAGLGALTANLKIGLRMLILLGMALMVFLLSAVLGGWEGVIVVRIAFPALMALYAAFDGKECEMEPVDEPVRPVQPVRMTAAPDEEALRALERLPKLRELGALSDEEYEQKKAELIMGGLTLVLIGMIKGGVLNGVLRIDQILLRTAHLRSTSLRSITRRCSTAIRPSTTTIKRRSPDTTWTPSRCATPTASRTASWTKRRRS